jgi:UDP-glucuronate 4-epimerase
MKNILVTGGAGFIGSNLIKALLKTNNCYVINFDNFDDFYSIKQKKNNISLFNDYSNYEFIEGDIRNSNDLEKINQKVDVVIHLAAKAGVRPSILNPKLYQDVNICGTQNLLEFSKERNISQFLFASSSSVYGANQNLPWKEDEKLLPISPYASTKLSGEMMGHVYSQLYDIRFVAMRFFTVYGPGQRPDLAIHKFFKSIYNGDPITMYGDGLTSRDYTYVDDIVSGIIEAIDYSDTKFEIVNLGNNQSVNLKTLISHIEKIVAKNAVIVNYPDQLGDLKHTYANISKAISLFKYNPKTDLEVGLNNFFAWYLSNKDFIT